jgi:hypothetical protein
MDTLYNRLIVMLGGEGGQTASHSIEKGMKATKGLWIYSLSAPIVVPIALLGCTWESEKLPNWARKWDNNVNLNGDNGDRIDETGDGVADVIRQPLEDTPEVRARTYWGWGPLKGKIHPRSFLARWIWIGFRNRGKQAFVDRGVHIDEGTKLVTTGVLGVRGVSEGDVAREMDGLWHYHSVKRKWKFFCEIEQRGWKVQNVDEVNRIAIPVSYKSYKLWK